MHLGLARDAGRVDLRLDAQGQAQFLEINPLAGLHPQHSDLPILCQLAGIDYWSPAETGPVYVDDVSLVPEPATLSLLGLLGLCFVTRYIWRSRKRAA